MGKTVPLPEDPSGGQRFQKKDASLALRNAESGVIDQVLVTTGDQGTRFIKVRGARLRLCADCMCLVSRRALLLLRAGADAGGICRE